MRKPIGPVLGLVALATVALAWAWFLVGNPADNADPQPGNDASSADSDQSVKHAPASAVAPGSRAAAELPREFHLRLPPLTTVWFEHRLEPRDFDHGVACPGGGFLPLLNGVPAAQPIHRDTHRFGPVPPVVGKFVDAAGDEWYVHADRSETTTRWTTVTTPAGPQRDVRTDHTVPSPLPHGLAPDTPDRLGR